MDTFQQLPPARTHRRIPFQKAEIIEGPRPGSQVLVVRGQAPCANMRVELVPVTYIQAPDWWQVEVVGSVPDGICLTALRPYSVTLSLDAVMGKEGVLLVGANRQLRIPAKQGGQPGEDEELEKIYTVNEVVAQPLEGRPDCLLIQAEGTTRTLGWTSPRLVSRDQSLPQDGVWTFDFLADRPDGPNLMALGRIHGELAWEGYGANKDRLKGIRVQGEEGSATFYFPQAEQGPQGPASGVELNEQVTLALEETITLDQGRLSLTFAEVTDSRCPSDVVCVWQGDAAVTLSADAGQGAEIFTLHTTVGPRSIELRSGYKIELVSLLPYPNTRARLARPKATLVITR